MEKKLTTPISSKDVEALRVGDIVYLDGILATCRDTGHKRRVLGGVIPKLSLEGGVIFHAGPIVKKVGDKWQMIAIGPTTSMRMEKFEKDFIELTGVKLIIGKGGMGESTRLACIKNKVVHTVFPGGCAVLAADSVEEITDVEWLDLGMPEAFWVCKVKHLGPLIVSIDTEGGNLFETNKLEFQKKKESELEKLYPYIKFMNY